MTLNLSTLTLKRDMDSANIVSNMLKVIVLNAQTHRQQMSDAFNDTNKRSVIMQKQTERWRKYCRKQNYPK